MTSPGSDMGNAVQGKINKILREFPRTVMETDSNASKSVALLSSLELALRSERNVVYISTPITTGRAHIAWLSCNRTASDAAKKSHKVSVIDRNLAKVRPLVSAATGKYPGPIVDPTQLEDVPGWEQGDYHSFWVEVIEKFASLVVFADEWSYSNGCCYEFAQAVRSGLGRLDAAFEMLGNQPSRNMLITARRELVALGLPTIAQSAALDSLSSAAVAPVAV